VSGAGGGRRCGYYDEEDESTTGYDSVLVYVRKGLGDQEILEPVIDFILKVQQGMGKPWPLVPLSHGWGSELKHLGRGILMGNANDRFARTRVAQEVASLAGNQSDPGQSVISSLFPRTDSRSLYKGKVSVTTRDLLVFVDFQNSLAFPSSVTTPPPLFKKGTVTVEVPADRSDSLWTYGPKKIQLASAETKSPDITGGIH
jgi:hypothetical protein